VLRPDVNKPRRWPGFGIEAPLMQAKCGGQTTAICLSQRISPTVL